MKKIYVLFLWGNAQSCHLTKEEAKFAGKALKEPTHDDGEYEYAEFTIQEWIVGQEVDRAKTYEYSYKLGKVKD